MTSIIVNANVAAMAWLNAFLATSQDDSRVILYRTLCVEIYETGVEFIATDATILFRTWVPKVENAPWPEQEESPLAAVVVMDAPHFALAFIRTLAAVSKVATVAEMSLTVEDAPEDDGEVPLGAGFSPQVLTLRALGQQMHCRLYDDKYVDWRRLNFGVEQAERVDGMTISTRMFATCGKLKGISAIDCTFTGDARQIVLTGDPAFKGILMPMRRREKEQPAPEPEKDEQTDALDVSVNGIVPEGMTATMSIDGGPSEPFNADKLGRSIHKKLRRTE